MARLTGPIQVEGRLGSISFYKNRDGKYIARRKGGPTPSMWRNHPHFANSRDNSAEFGSASTMAGKIRYVFEQYMEYSSEGSYFNRLMGLVHEIAKYDPESMRGQRHFSNGNIYLLEDFQWNKKLSFSDALKTESGYFMNAETGKVQVQFSSFVPLTAVKAPAGASHFQIIVKAGRIYEGEKVKIGSLKASEIIRINSMETGMIDLELDVAPNERAGAGLMLMGSGIIFYEEVEGVLLPLRGGAFGLMSVEHTEPYEAPVRLDEETGELVDRKDEIVKAKEERKAKRAAALKYQAAFIDQFGYRILKGMLPIVEDPEKREDMERKRKELERKMWLRKLERYRKG